LDILDTIELGGVFFCAKTLFYVYSFDENDPSVLDFDPLKNQKNCSGQDDVAL
jgi:hypothetical protein